MGGYGSSRWSGHAKAETVEDSLVLDVVVLMRKKLLSIGTQTYGSIRWTYTRDGSERAAIGFNVDTTNPSSAFVLLDYKVGGEPQRYSVSMTTTHPPLGGLRWWWRCPAVGCTRRVRKLYLPPSSRVFACRTCHHLTYESVQTHDGRVDRIVRGGLASLVNMGADASLRDLLLVAKAEAKIVDKMRAKGDR